MSLLCPLDWITVQSPVQYSGRAPILWSSAHPRPLTRPRASLDTGRDGCEDARLRMEAAGPAARHNPGCTTLVPVSL